jgi:hypothetical protein
VKSALEEKYPDAYMSEGEDYGYDSMQLYTAQGGIDLYVSKYDDVYPTEYTLHVDYFDDVNFKKNENSKMNDL